MLYWLTSPHDTVEAKSGVEPANCLELVKYVKSRCPNLEFSGLMTIGMPDYTSTPANFKVMLFPQCQGMKMNHLVHCEVWSMEPNFLGLFILSIFILLSVVNVDLKLPDIGKFRMRFSSFYLAQLTLFRFSLLPLHANLLAIILFNATDTFKL